eukprot:symbB.v1.2.004040.t1/scaffold228.1/size260974/9
MLAPRATCFPCKVFGQGWDDACYLLKGLCDPLHCNSVVASCDGSLWALAVAVLDVKRQDSLEAADVFALNSAISTCAKEGREGPVYWEHDPKMASDMERMFLTFQLRQALLILLGAQGARLDPDIIRFAGVF